MFVSSESAQNNPLLKSPCGAAGIGSKISRGREDPEESLEKRDRKDAKPRGNEGGIKPGVRTDSDLTMNRK